LTFANYDIAQAEQFEYVYVLSFACAKERTKEKHTGNDLQPLSSR